MDTLSATELISMVKDRLKFLSKENLVEIITKYEPNRRLIYFPDLIFYKSAMYYKFNYMLYRYELKKLFADRDIIGIVSFDDITIAGKIKGYFRLNSDMGDLIYIGASSMNTKSLVRGWIRGKENYIVEITIASIIIYKIENEKLNKIDFLGLRITGINNFMIVNDYLLLNDIIYKLDIEAGKLTMTSIFHKKNAEIHYLYSKNRFIVSEKDTKSLYMINIVNNEIIYEYKFEGEYNIQYIEIRDVLTFSANESVAVIYNYKYSFKERKFLNDDDRLIVTMLTSDIYISPNYDDSNKMDLSTTSDDKEIQTIIGSDIDRLHIIPSSENMVDILKDVPIPLNIKNIILNFTKAIIFNNI